MTIDSKNHLNAKFVYHKTMLDNTILGFMSVILILTR